MMTAESLLSKRRVITITVALFLSVRISYVAMLPVDELFTSTAGRFAVAMVILDVGGRVGCIGILLRLALKTQIITLLFAEATNSL